MERTPTASPTRRLPGWTVALPALVTGLLLATEAGAAFLPRAQALERGRSARVAEESGSYAMAANTLRALRTEVEPDPDLDLTLALDEARCGRLDAAAELLWSPLLERALADSLPVQRRHFMPWIREEQWFDGRFDGWHWYVARARFEVAYAQRRWDEARRAAEACVAARPLASVDWLALALAAGRTGDEGAARAAAARAVALDPALPEAHHVAGVLAWRAGERAEAQARFRAAAALDSSSAAPVLALMRLRLPGTRPDSLPGVLLEGARSAALLTSPVGPKLEELVQFDAPARLAQPARVPLDSSWTVRTQRFEMILPVLIDERGRAIANLMPWLTEDRIHASAVAALLGSLPDWRFTPAMKGGTPRRSWVAIPYRLEH